MSRFLRVLCPLCLLSGGCIQSNPRSSGAHDICVTVNGSNNTFNLHTERSQSAQDADNKGGNFEVSETTFETVKTGVTADWTAPAPPSPQDWVLVLETDGQRHLNRADRRKQLDPSSNSKGQK